ncbi:hypothetical protein Hanom_Chr04g00329121 [Helianthus anomalus]
MCQTPEGQKHADYHLQIISRVLIAIFFRVCSPLFILEIIFWLDLILQFGIRAWYSNLGFNNLQIHPKSLIFI